ncbi:hypothetical protein H5R88_08605 [Limosilactobacillus sp. WF-MT5-A]|uniref:hypothetical protein n=1 Tax=Limosilactobacillus agrestis TaxID=2759748 RepID=UPI0015F9B512|nr:hypothetical protein [Limosilactobacillus agrestis]MBB1100142.1 hypothetical protein [Limosilactobacillus agrestis]
MHTLFISGSLSVKRLPLKVEKAINSTMQNKYHIVLGDARGADNRVQTYLKRQDYDKVTVYYIRKEPRYYLNNLWKKNRVPIDETDDKLFKNGRYTQKAQMQKDFQMCLVATSGLVVWNDIGKNRFGREVVSKGSLNNIVNLLSQNKPVGIYYVPKPDEGLIKVRNISEFENKVINRLVAPQTKKYYYSELTKNYKKSDQLSLKLY